MCRFVSHSVCQRLVKHLDTQDWVFTDDIPGGGGWRFYNAEDSRRSSKVAMLEEIASADEKLTKDMLLGVSPSIKSYWYLPDLFFKGRYA